MVSPHFSARYTAAMADCGGRCPIEAGVLGRLADHECRHGRLPFDRTPACGCWPRRAPRSWHCLRCIPVRVPVVERHEHPSTREITDA